MKENNIVAVFIDAENVSSKFADKIMEEASNYGDVIIKRAFADWSNGAVEPWRTAVSKHSIIAEQQFSAVRGKNSGDIALIIDAMVVLFEKNIDVFCLASSDSDFSRLVQELRERGKTVVGFGKKITKQEFVNAFTEFIYLDEIKEETPIEQEVSKDKKVPNRNKTKEQSLLEKGKMKTLVEIIERLIEEGGKALYSQIAKEMKNKYSDFIPKNYGYKTMKEFMNKLLKNKYTTKTDSDGTTLYFVPKIKNTTKK